MTATFRTEAPAQSPASYFVAAPHSLITNCQCPSLAPPHKRTYPSYSGTGWPPLLSSYNFSQSLLFLWTRFLFFSPWLASYPPAPAASIGCTFILYRTEF